MADPEPPFDEESLEGRQCPDPANPAVGGPPKFGLT